MKSNLYKLFSCTIFLSVLIVSCSEFIEKDVSDQKVFLIAPSDSLESSRYNQTFSWEAVEGAQTYRLQIAAGSFDSISYMVEDTLIKTTKMGLVLEPGKYQWRVRAQNSGSSSLYSTNTLIIHESSLVNQQVQLKAPGIDFVTNQKDVTFSWYGIFGAQVYRLQIDTNNFANENQLFFEIASPNIQSMVSFSKDRVYQWRVRAESSSEVSKWSKIQNFTFDATLPEKVSLISPTMNQLISKPINLQWSSVPGATKFELFLYQSDGTTMLGSFPKVVLKNDYTFNEGDSNESFYWKVRAIDAAGNVGPFSETRSFTVK